jgi:hypothetical protein
MERYSSKPTQSRNAKVQPSITAWTSALSVHCSTMFRSCHFSATQSGMNSLNRVGYNLSLLNKLVLLFAHRVHDVTEKLWD